MFDLSFSPNVQKLESLEILPKGADRPASTKWKSAIYWQEHCVECAIPDCYQMCQLFIERIDGKCARFKNGINPYWDLERRDIAATGIEFRRWGKLEAVEVQPFLYPARLIDFLWRIDRILSGLSHVPDRFLNKIFSRKSISHKIYSNIIRNILFRTILLTASPMKRPANDFRIHFDLNENTGRQINFEVMKKGRLIFRDAFMAKPGRNSYNYSFRDMKLETHGYLQFRLFLDSHSTANFTFYELDFVDQNEAILATTGDAKKNNPSTRPKIKCVVWDVDNTIWNGVIADNGHDVTVNDSAIALMKILDERGIIQSVASKNDHEIAFQKLKELEIDHYFISPKINWKPKSHNIAELANELNIHLDTFAFIDDSNFERSEVATSIPEIRCYHPDEISNIPGYKEFDVIITESSKMRRLSYQSEQVRRDAIRFTGGDYQAFLESCEMHLNIDKVGEEEIDRCYELLQRTNQLNLSTHRYSIEEFTSLLKNKDYISLRLRSEDKFGDYGLIGFVSIKKGSESYELVDFIFSCRVAQKGIEAAFLGWYLAQLQQSGERILLKAVFKKTDRNTPIEESLDNMPMQVEKIPIDNGSLYSFSLEGDRPPPTHIKIDALELS